MTVQLEFIKSMPYFSGLSQAELDSIRGVVFEKKADRGEILLFEGEPAETLYFVVAGAVKVFKVIIAGGSELAEVRSALADLIDHG